MRIMNRPPKIANLGNAEWQDDIFRLDIPMNDAIEMQFVESLAYASHDRMPLVFSQFAFNLKNIIELATWTILQQQIDIETIMEIWIELDNIDMIEVWLDLNLSDELFHEILPLYCLFFNHFYRKYNARHLMPKANSQYTEQWKPCWTSPHRSSSPV